MATHDTAVCRHATQVLAMDADIVTQRRAIRIPPLKKGSRCASGPNVGHNAGTACPAKLLGRSRVPILARPDTIGRIRLPPPTGARPACFCALSYINILTTDAGKRAADSEFAAQASKTRPLRLKTRFVTHPPQNFHQTRLTYLLSQLLSHNRRRHTSWDKCTFLHLFKFLNLKELFFSESRPNSPVFPESGPEQTSIK